jgi:hypothetical protein
VDGAPVSDFITARDRSPTVAEPPRSASKRSRSSKRCKRAAAAARPSLQAARATDLEPMLQDTIGEAEDGFELAESRADLNALMGGLSPPLREIVRLRFDEDLTSADLANAEVHDRCCSPLASSASRCHDMSHQHRAMDG